MSLFVFFGMKRLCFGHIIYPLLTRKFVRSRRLSIGVVFSLYDFVFVHKKIQTSCLHAWSLTYMSYISLLPCRELRKDEDYFYGSVFGRCPLQGGHSNRHTWKKIVQSQRLFIANGTIHSLIWGLFSDWTIFFQVSRFECSHCGRGTWLSTCVLLVGLFPPHLTLRF